MSWVCVGIAINWGGLYVLSLLYVLWLWVISGDVRWGGLIWWRSFFPVARFRLVSKKSRFARLWVNFYGHGLYGAMIHRDELGSFDDAFVEKTIVHELRHHVQQFVLGLVFYVLYGLSYVWNVSNGRDGYYHNWFERDARRAADRWAARGRPRIFDFGTRH